MANFLGGISWVSGSAEVERLMAEALLGRKALSGCCVESLLASQALSGSLSFGMT